MRKSIIIAGALTALVATTFAQARPGDRLRERMAQRQAGGETAAARADQTIAYGSDPKQQLDLWYPADHNNEQSRPLVLFVHGGGWSKGDKGNATGRLKPPHYTGQGYVFASINYRLVPNATVEQQAADVAAALKALVGDYKKFGIDTSRVVIMGHSAGAHLVALVGTDERYLRGVGLSFADIDGVIPIDGAAFDVAQQLRQAGPRMQGTYTAAFGTDPARQRALSPTLHAAAPNAPAFYIPHVGRADAVQQSNALGAALRAAGTPAEVRQFEGQGLMGHMEINRRLGDPDYAATPVVDDWLKRVFGN
jgi:acetyl esterase/lipase